MRLLVAVACMVGLMGQSAFATTAPSPIATFSFPRPRANEYLGYGLATDGQRVLMGAGAGSAYLFDPFTKQQLASVLLPDPRFGTSVVREGNMAVVGATYSARLYDCRVQPAGAFCRFAAGPLGWARVASALEPSD